MPMVLPENLVNVDLHRFPLNLWQQGGGVMVYNYNIVGGVYVLGKLLCTTDERAASCAGHQLVVWGFGWLCTTGTGSLFCAGNLYCWLQPQMNLMIMRLHVDCVDWTQNLSFAKFILHDDHRSLYVLCLFWACWFCPDTGLWSCNRVFDRGIGFLGRVLCTTDRRVASCAGHQVVGLEDGWLCTTGTDPEICAGNLYWFIQSLVIFMNIETELVLGTKSSSVLITLSRSGGCDLLADYFSFVVSFVFRIGYGVVSFYKSGAVFDLYCWFSYDNKPCTLFPCSKFSHRVFIWQGFLMRQGDWWLGDLMVQPPQDLIMLIMQTLDTFEQASCCNLLEMLAGSAGFILLVCYADLNDAVGLLMLIWSIIASSPCLNLSILLSMGLLWMVMFGAPLVDSLGVTHVFRVCKGSLIMLSIY